MGMVELTGYEFANVIQWNQVSRVRLFLEAGINVNETVKTDLGIPRLSEKDSGFYYYTPLHVAAMGGNNAIVSLLIDYNANLNARVKGHYGNITPLETAYIHNKLETLKSLVKSGADVNSRNEEGLTLLMLAATSRTILWREMVNPIWRETVECLLNNGADVDAKDNRGWTALMYARDYRNEAAREAIRQFGGKEK